MEHNRVLGFKSMYQYVIPYDVFWAGGRYLQINDLSRVEFIGTKLNLTFKPSKQRERLIGVRFF
jgi:hypothetical protein